MVRQQQAVDDVLEGLEQLKRRNETSMSDIAPSLGVSNHHVPS